MSVIEQHDDWPQIVEDDVRSFFQDCFPMREPDDGFGTPEPFNDAPPMGNSRTLVVPWRWRGRHEQTFFEVRATGNPVEIVGVTLISEDDDGLVFQRIVDWLTMYRQMGLVMVCRRPRHADPEDGSNPDLNSEEFDTIDIPVI